MACSMHLHCKCKCTPGILHFKRKPLPQIPWLEKHGRITNFSQSKMAELIKHKDAAKDKQQLFLALSEVVPYYLPESCHQMSLKTSKRKSAIEQYWRTTFCFLFHCSNFDHTHMAKLIDKVINGETNLFNEKPTMIGTYELVMKKSKESHQNQCANTARFLLEPWILLQIPFQPTLLHQWAVALLAEALLFQQKISPLFSYGCSPKFTNIMENLRKMMNSMRNCANFTLKMYLKMCTEALKKNIYSVLLTQMEEFSNHLTTVLPILEFVTSAEASKLIGAIERMCLEELNGGGELSPPQVVIQTSDEQPTPIYDFWFWTKECDLKEVFTGTTGDRGRNNAELLSKRWKKGELEGSRLNALKELVDEKIIQTERLREVDRDVISAAVEKHATKLSIYCDHYHEYYETSSEGLKMKDGVFGVINNIICLYADTKIVEVIDLLTRHIFEQIKKTHPDVVICNPKEFATTEQAINEIESRFDHILANKEWTWDKILADAKELSSFSSSPMDVNLKQVSPKVLAQHFQSAIRHLSYKIAERHFATLKIGNFEYVPEHLFVQYALPCFVLNFLRVFKESSASWSTKLKLFQITLKLINSYDEQEYVQVLSNEVRAAIQDQRDVGLCTVTKDFPLLYFIFDDYAVVNDFLNLLDYFRIEFKQEIHFTNKIIVEGGTVIHSRWFNEIDMLMCRISSSLNIYCDQTRLIVISASVVRALATADKNAHAISTLLSNVLLKEGDLKERIPDINMVLKLSQSHVSALPPTETVKSARDLSCQQLAGLFVFLHFGTFKAAEKYSQWKDKFQGPGFPLDMSCVLLWSVATDDRWKIKQLMGPLLMAGWHQNGKEPKDPSIVSLGFVKSNRCYKRVLEMISPDGTRVQMKQLGQITFVPIKHCRWCGLIKAEKFRLCPLCLDCPEYLDVNYFCSEMCETRALDSKHREEHARYFTVKLGLNK